MSEQTNPIISFKNFSFQYRAQKKPTLHDINLDIYPGERVLIAGPSGSGKSTLAACINGLNPFSYPGECTGSLTVDGVDAPNSSIFELSAHVGTVLQDPDGQFIGLTVGEDIAFALENSCVPQKEMHEITRHAAELVGIENRLDHAPHELSGGQKQRVSLAGVMVDQVKILMFDEPLASLDPATGKQAIELIDEIQHKTDTTVLIIEHRLEDVLWRNVDRIILVNEGTILADLRPDELLATHMLAENGIREPLYLTAMRYAGIAITPEKRPAHVDTVVLDDADTALSGNGDRHFGLGNGVHGSGHNGDVEFDISRETGLDTDLSRQHFRIGGYKQHIVERKSFGLNPFIDKRHNERGFLLLAKVIIFFETA